MLGGDSGECARMEKTQENQKWKFCHIHWFRPSLGVSTWMKKVSHKARQNACESVPGAQAQEGVSSWPALPGS